MQPIHSQAEQIGSAMEVLREILGEALLAVHLHGSAASGRLQPRSDIDLLVVVGRDLIEVERDHLTVALMRLSGRHPAAPEGPRCLEVMVFRRADLAGGDYPARAEFVYGEWLRDSFEVGERVAPARDPEHTLVLAQARQTAVPLFGPDARELLPEIPAEQIRQACETCSRVC